MHTQNHWLCHMGQEERERDVGGSVTAKKIKAMIERTTQIPIATAE